ncbi:MAG TPA: YbaN family protein [Hyphomonadaceae bacterium]|nr:YbaN family protein [Hyphomonadaceae bacterium]
MMTEQPDPPPAKSPASVTALTTPAWLRPIYLVAGLLSVGLGVIGIFVPGMPTTVFLIIAAGCFAKSSPRLEAWLLNHPRLGPSVRAWRTHKAIPRRAKIIAIVSMAISFAIVLLIHLKLWVTAIIGLVLLASALYVGTRPDGPKAEKT